MGLDLTLIPIRYHKIEWWLATDTLSTQRDGLGHLINDGVHAKTLKTHPIPSKKDFRFYDDDGLKKRTTDPYGGKLRYVKAGKLAEFFEDIGEENPNVTEFSEWNQGIMDFVKRIPSETPIVLWWH